MGTMQWPSTVPTKDRARSGFRSSAPGMGGQALGTAVLPAPLGLSGAGVRVSARVSLRPGSKEDTELSCTHVRAKLASATRHAPP